MNVLNGALVNHIDYPRNLPLNLCSIHDTEKDYENIVHEEFRVFEAEAQASIDVFDHDPNAGNFRETEVHNDDELRSQLRIPNPQNLKDPLCRYVFIHARSSRDRLKITRSMLSVLCTYHMLSPIFFELLFLFGKQNYAKDFYLSGFRSMENFSQSVNNILSLPNLGRSGLDFQLCYNLRSVESTLYPEDWPWSIRQTMVHHSFDTRTGRTIWLMVKGNKLIRERFSKALKIPQSSDLNCFSTQLETFSASLTVHLILCEWSRENWASYISFIEDQFQRKTRSALNTPTIQHGHRIKPSEPPIRSTTVPSPPMINQGTRRANTVLSPTAVLRGLRRFTFLETKGSSVVLDTDITDAPSIRSKVEIERPSFCLDDLLSIQDLEEKANETLLVINSNISIMEDIRNYYISLLENHDFPTPLQTDAKHTVNRFAGGVKSVIHDLELQKARLQTLSTMIADRKAMLLVILSYRNMESTERLSIRAQQSTDNMERSTINMENVTNFMKDVALKTESETVFMRIITVITLFFLPGTFVSTLMSTDILRFSSDDGKHSHRVFSREALKAFFAIVVPIMAVTIAGSYILFTCEKHATKKRRKKANKLSDDF